MTISEKIFERLDQLNMTQKEFSALTSIPQSTISDWRKKNTNPASDKILIICDVLEMTPYELLSGVSEQGNRTRGIDYQVVAKDTDEGLLIEQYEKLSDKMKQRVLGYIEALEKCM